MSESEKFESPGTSEIAELRSDVQALQSTLSLALVLMFIFTVAVNIYFFNMAKRASAEANGAQAVINAYVGGGETQARDLWLKLSAYASAHPDYATVMNKYSQYIVVHSNAAPAAAPVKK